MRALCASPGIVSSLLFFAGCDPGVMVAQQYVLQIADIASGAPASGAVITSWVANRRRGGMTEEEFLDEIQDEGRSRIADESGQATLTLCSVVLCAGSQCEHPSTLDELTAETFLVRIESDTGSEIVSLKMIPGNSVSGEVFTVTVISIAEPVPYSLGMGPCYADSGGV